MRFGYTSQVSAAAARSQARPTEMKDLVDAGYLVIGSPDEVVEQIDELATNLHVGNLMLLMQFGNMSKELTKYNTKLFAEQVMPKLQRQIRRIRASLVAEADGHRVARRNAGLRA